jgi:uncharacterized membrane protein
MNKLTTLSIGLTILLAESAVVFYVAIVDPSLFAKISAMVIANHIGGRLAFIFAGLENEFPIHSIILIILFYNTTYLLLMYSLFVICSKQIKKIAVFRYSTKSMHKKANRSRRMFKKWNRIIVFLFVWAPLPWTGAVIGSYIAHLEGYNTRDTLLTVISAMWIGIISWTIWFDELYRFIENFGKEKTIYSTIALLIIPIFVFIIDFLRKKEKANHWS